MIYTIKDYSEIFKFNGKNLSAKTIIRRGLKKQLPTNHEMQKVGRVYIIEVKNKFTELKS